MKRHENLSAEAGFEPGTPIQNREAFLHLMTTEDLDVLSGELGVSASTLSHWRGQELKRLTDALGVLPADEQLFDRELFERRAAV